MSEEARADIAESIAKHNRKGSSWRWVLGAAVSVLLNLVATFIWMMAGNPGQNEIVATVMPIDALEQAGAELLNGLKAFSPGIRASTLMLSASRATAFARVVLGRSLPSPANQDVWFRGRAAPVPDIGAPPETRHSSPCVGKRCSTSAKGRRPRLGLREIHPPPRTRRPLRPEPMRRGRRHAPDRSPRRSGRRRRGRLC